MRFATIEHAIEWVRRGKIIIVVDDKNRENEGDFVIAAEKITPEAISFMAKKGSGLICISLTGKRLDKLGIPLMWYRNESKFGTGFAVSVSARNGVTTGISAADRATTIKTLIDPKTRRKDLVIPGHVFPLRARSGGVRQRQGHTEASIEIARVAGFYPAGVICEIMNNDGTMARIPELFQLSKTFEIPVVSITDIVDFLQRNHRQLNSRDEKEKNIVQKVTETILPTRFGQFNLSLYEEENTTAHLALSYGRKPFHGPILTRIHSSCLTGEVFTSLRCDCRWQMEEALRRIKTVNQGVFIYLIQEGRGLGLVDKLRAYALQDNGLDTVEANIHLGFTPDLRTYEVAASILGNLGIEKVRLLTNNPSKVKGLSDCGIDVVERISLKRVTNQENKYYLATKKAKLGHLL